MRGRGIIVTCEYRGKKETPSITTNTILKDIHPVLWASKPIENFTKVLLFWSELPDEVAEKAEKMNYFTIEYNQGSPSD